MTATDPTPAPGISEERLRELEGRWSAVPVTTELLAEVRRLRQQVEANEAKDALLAVAAAQFDAIRALRSSHG